MKKPLLLVALAGIGLAAVILFRVGSPAPEEKAPSKVTTAAENGGTLEVSQDAKEIFRRAFWRQPTDADRILHAERREWADAEHHVQRWQWFLEVEPSNALMSELQDADRFALNPVTASPQWNPPASSPSWFPAEAHADYEILKAPAGSLMILRHRQKNRIFATDEGQGFAAPARPL